MQGVISML